MSADRRPPRVPGLAVTNTARFYKDPFSLLERAQKAHGDLFSVKLLGLGEWTFLCSPALVKEMFKAPTDVLSAGENNGQILGFMLGKDATFSLEGDAHRQRQWLVHPFLNQPSKILGHVPAIRQVALRILDRWPRDRPFAFLDQGHRISLDVMLHVLFGDSEDETLDHLRELFEVFAGKGCRSPLIPLSFLQINLGPKSPWGKILEMRRRVMEAFGAEIDRRLPAMDAEGGEPGEPDAATDDLDVLSQLASTPQRNGVTLSRQSLLEEVINLLFAGHETTGTIMTWTMETLHSHPEVLDRTLKELDEVLGGEPVSAETVPQLEYLDAVIQETIRYRPIAPMAGIRRVEKPFELDGRTLAPGSIVTQCFPRMARRPELFERPDVFDPNHFYQRRMAPFTWNAFGGGTRMCVGRGLAELELKVVLATLLQNARFTIAQEAVTPERSGMFFGPSQGLRLEVGPVRGASAQ